MPRYRPRTGKRALSSKHGFYAKIAVHPRQSVKNILVEHNIDPGPRAPNLNAVVERWIQSLKHEALDHFVIFSQKHFDHICSEYVSYYHDYRPHQGIGNRLTSEHQKVDDLSLVAHIDQIKCETRSGRLLKYYHRAA